MPRIKTLIVEDDPTLRSFLGEVGRGLDLNCVIESRGDQALIRIKEDTFQLIISDVKLPGCGGIDLLKSARQKNPDIPVILMTAFATVDLAVSAMREGAVEFLQKPFSAELLEGVIRNCVEKIELQKDLEALERERPRDVMIGQSEAFSRIRSVIEKVALSDASVFIHGETGVGKELVAREIHRRSLRAGKRLVTLHVPAIADTMVEAELFGHERGAFTGAIKDRSGLLELADGGSLFLDEIADLSPSTQVKILRFLQERSFRRVGSNSEIEVDVRIICATNRNLELEVKQGRFREDLFYRLNVVPVIVPPLRERRKDIPLLVEHFLKKYAAPGSAVPKISDGVMAKYMEYAWPGNVRELESVIARASALAGGDEIVDSYLPDSTSSSAAVISLPEDGFSLGDHLASVEKSLIVQALESERGVRARAAERLGIKRTTLLEKMGKYGIE